MLVFGFNLICLARYDVWKVPADMAMAGAGWGGFGQGDMSRLGGRNGHRKEDATTSKRGLQSLLREEYD